MSQPSLRSGATVDPPSGLPINFDHFERLDQQQQLFRYAQDLQELQAMQRRLQQRHEKVLQFFGRGEQDVDVLLNSILKSISMYLVTDKEGLIMQASPEAEKAFSQPGRSLNWLPLQQLMLYKERDRIKGIIQSFSGSGASGAIHQDRLFLCAGDPKLGGQGYEVLALMAGMEIFWLLGQPVDASADTPNIEQAFPLFGDAHEALLITDANASIRAVNPAFTRITGYGAAEVTGQNPRMRSSGLQDPLFYRNLWNQLQQNGSWTGELFNRRKDGQIYLEWVTIKAVKNSLRQTVSYISSFADLPQGADEDKRYSLVAHTDLLTGLANRRMFEVQLTRALSNAALDNSSGSVLWVSLERFDELARELGHEEADQLLQASGKRLQEQMAAGSTVARVGGGDFLVLLPNNPNASETERAVKLLHEAFTKPFSLARGDISVTTVSVGSACYPKDGTDVEELLRIANSEMHYQSPIMKFAIARPDDRLPPAYRLHPGVPSGKNSHSLSEIAMTKILIVDDHSDIRRLLAMTLGKGYELLEAEDGATALDIVRRHAPKVVLLDIMMPGAMDGLQVLEKIKGDPLSRGTAVAMITARGQAADGDDARKRGADAYFIKPFSPLEVVAWVRDRLT